LSPRGTVGLARKAAKEGLLFSVLENATNSFSTFSNKPACKKYVLQHPIISIGQNNNNIYLTSRRSRVLSVMSAKLLQ
jgi:hypothetical protein